MGTGFAFMLGVAPALAEKIVFLNGQDNGWFTPFDASTAAGTLYGDGGWLSGGGAAPLLLTRIELGLAAQDGSTDGSVDIVFTLNDGDPSGLVFGSGAPLYQTVIQNVTLPGGSGAQFFSLSIDLPNVATLGGYNNVGWSVGVANFDFDGGFGFQYSSANSQTIGYYTNNASYYDGSSWSLFSFGSDPVYGVANFVARIYTPEPASLALLAVVALCRRR